MSDTLEPDWQYYRRRVPSDLIVQKRIGGFFRVCLRLEFADAGNMWDLYHALVYKKLVTNSP